MIYHIWIWFISSPTPLTLSKLSLLLLGTMGNVKKKENYLIYLFCTSRGFPEEGKQKKNRILEIACWLLWDVRRYVMTSIPSWNTKANTLAGRSIHIPRFCLTIGWSSVPSSLSWNGLVFLWFRPSVNLLLWLTKVYKQKPGWDLLWKETIMLIKIPGEGRQLAQG